MINNPKDIKDILKELDKITLKELDEAIKNVDKGERIMQSKEEIENNRIPKQLAKALGIEKEDTDILIAFKQSLYEQTVKENIKLKKQVEQLETKKQKVIEKLEKDISEYPEAIYTKWYLVDCLKILKGKNNE